ncbi:MAG TPA: hypothetical protein VMY18_06970, partial [Acidobacteriota bacterium]|nr:hypothetical protein [Acidobacteriota bacterium]
ILNKREKSNKNYAEDLKRLGFIEDSKQSTLRDFKNNLDKSIAAIRFRMNRFAADRGMTIDSNDIVPANVPTARGDQSGGNVGFRASAEAGAIPSAGQAATEATPGFAKTAEQMIAERAAPEFQQPPVAPPYRRPSVPDPTRGRTAEQRRADIEAEMRREVDQPPVEQEVGTYPEGQPGAGAMSKMQRSRELRRLEKIDEGKTPGNIRMPGERFSMVKSELLDKSPEDLLKEKFNQHNAIALGKQLKDKESILGLKQAEETIKSQMDEMKKSLTGDNLEEFMALSHKKQMVTETLDEALGFDVELKHKNSNFAADRQAALEGVASKERYSQSKEDETHPDQTPTRFVSVEAKDFGSGNVVKTTIKVTGESEKFISGVEVTKEGEPRKPKGNADIREHVIDKKAISSLKEMRISKKYGELEPKKERYSKSKERDDEKRVLPVLVTESGKKYPGESHADALARAKKLREEGKISNEDYAEVAIAMMDDASHQFVDSNGRLMNRAEAGEFTGLDKELQSEAAKKAGMLLPLNTFGERFSKGREDDLTPSNKEEKVKYEEQTGKEKITKGGEVSDAGRKSIDEVRAEESKVAQDLLYRARQSEKWNQFEVEISPESSSARSYRIRSIIEGTLHGMGMSDIASSEIGVRIVHDFVIDKRLHHFAKTFLETGEVKFYDKEISNSVHQFINSRIGKARLNEIQVEEFTQNIENLSYLITGRGADDPAGIAMVAEMEAAFDRFANSLPNEYKELVKVRMTEGTLAYQSAREAYMKRYNITTDSSFAKRVNKVAKLMLEDPILREILFSGPSEKIATKFQSEALLAEEKKKAQDRAYYLKKGKSKGERHSLSKVEDVFKQEKKKGRGVGAIASDSVEAFRNGFASNFRPTDKLAEDIGKTYGVTTPKGIAGIFEAIKGATGKAEADVYRFDRDVYKLVKGNELDFNAYMFANRGIDRLTQDAADASRAASARSQLPALRRAVKSAPSRPAQAAALKAYKQTLKVARIKPRRMVGNFTIPELQSALRQLEAKLGPEKMANMKRASDNFQQHMDAALRLQVESGRMSQEVYDAIKAGNLFYAPFKLAKYVEMTNRPEVSGSRIDTMADYTKAMEGIESIDFKLSDILAASRQAIVTSRILADKNNAMRRLADLAAFDTGGLFIRKLKTGQHPPDRMMAVNVLELGKKNRYAVNPDVARAIEMHGKATQEGLSRFLALFATPFRAGATALNLPFQVSNLLADTPRAALVSKYGIRGVEDAILYPLEFFHALYSSNRGDVSAVKNITDVAGKIDPTGLIKRLNDASDRLFLDFLDSGTAGVTVQEHFTPSMMRYRPSTMTSKTKHFGREVLYTIPEFAAAIEQTSKILGVKRAMRFHGVRN